VPDSGPAGAPLRLDAADDDAPRRAERLPAGADRRHLSASADPDGRHAGAVDRVPVRQDLNVACLTHAYPRWDGDVAGAFIERLVLALQARGHGVHVVAPADAGVGGEELRHQTPVTRVRYAPARWETLAYRGTMVAAARSPAGLLWAASLVQRQARVLARLWRDERLDVVHAHWWIPAGVSAWLAGRPYVVTLHGTDVALLERSRAARLVGQRVLHGAAAVTAVSSYLADRAARAAQLEPGRVLVQLMPLDTLVLTRTRLGGEVPAAVGDADVFVFPAVGEGLGLVAAEALLLGVPVVATRDGGGVTDIVPETGAGRLVSPDAREIARAIEQLTSNPESRRLAAAAGVALRRRFDPAVVAQRFEALYSEVAAQHRRADCAQIALVGRATRRRQRRGPDGLGP